MTVQTQKNLKTVGVLCLVILVQICAVPVRAGATSTVPLWAFDTGVTVSDVAVSSDGRYIAAEAGASTLLFDREITKPVWSYENGRAFLAMSSDGERIAAASNEGNTVYLLDRDSGKPIWAYYVGDKGYLQTVAISSDGNYVAAGSDESALYLFSSANREPLWKHKFTLGAVTFVSITSDGAYVVVAPAYTIYLFSRDDGKWPLWRVSIPDESDFQGVAISADGTYIAAATHRAPGSDLVYLFKRGVKEALWSYKIEGIVDSIDISSDGEYTAVGTIGKEYTGIYVFSNRDGAQLWRYPTNDDVYSVALSSNGEYLAAGSIDHGVYMFNKNNAAPLWTYMAGDYIYDVAISSDGEYVAAASLDEKVYLFSREIRTPSTTTESQSHTTHYQTVSSKTEESSTPVWTELSGPLTAVALVTIAALLLYVRFQRKEKTKLTSGWKYCVNCRCKLPTNAAFCDACGTKQTEG